MVVAGVGGPADFFSLFLLQDAGAVIYWWSQLRKDREMRPYIAFYRGRQLQVEAGSSYEAQLIASKLFKARKSYEVTVMLADVEHNPAIL